MKGKAESSSSTGQEGRRAALCSQFLGLGRVDLDTLKKSSSSVAKQADRLIGFASNVPAIEMLGAYIDSSYCYGWNSSSKCSGKAN